MTDLVQSHSRPDEPILVFPHMPVFYGLTDRPLSTFSYMHWIDVCPDAVADRDAQAVTAAPPSVIVMMDLGPEGLRREEGSFRGGKVSGQQRLLAAIYRLLPDYELVGKFPVPHKEWNGDKLLTVQVWARHAERAEAASDPPTP